MPPRINPPKRIKRVITLAKGKCTGTSTADAFISNGFWLEMFFKGYDTKVICVNGSCKVVLPVFT
jgi:hypothetical protein